MTALEIMIGQLSIKKPKSNQNATPLANTTYITSEMALVSRCLMMCSAWGTKAAVVRIAASAETQVAMSDQPMRAVALRSHVRSAVLSRLLDLAPNARVIGIQPGKLLAVEQVSVDQPAVERHERQGLEAKHLARAAFDRCRRRHQHEIFEPDAVAAFTVKPRLV